MLRSTIRQMASISGRAIIAIGLTSATVLAFTPSVKAAPIVTPSQEIGADLEKIESITFDSTSDITRVPLSKNSALAATKVGDLTVISNNEAGFVLSVTSTNKGKLLHGSYAVPYSMTYDAAAVSIAADTGLGTVLDATGFQSDYAAATGVSKEIKISITAANTNGIPSGVYADTLVFAYTAK